ncbi:MAG: hypothetical protein M0C28_37775 [Candidatus Moduliflexus flocculans]|nr:hypothetical protein [Candidatus Moduliflexus flocculans]
MLLVTQDLPHHAATPRATPRRYRDQDEVDDLEGAATRSSASQEQLVEAGLLDAPELRRHRAPRRRVGCRSEAVEFAGGRAPSPTSARGRSAGASTPELKEPRMRETAPYARRRPAKPSPRRCARDESGLLHGRGRRTSTAAPSASSKGMLEEFGPSRVRDTPIIRGRHRRAAAVGAAMTGHAARSWRSMFSDFVAVRHGPDRQPGGQDPLPCSAARSQRAAGDPDARTASGTGAAAQHSQSLEAWFVHTPGLKVVDALRRRRTPRAS